MTFLPTLYHSQQLSLVDQACAASYAGLFSLCWLSPAPPNGTPCTRHACIGNGYYLRRAFSCSCSLSRGPLPDIFVARTKAAYGRSGSLFRTLCHGGSASFARVIPPFFRALKVSSCVYINPQRNGYLRRAMQTDNNTWIVEAQSRSCEWLKPGTATGAKNETP